MAMIVKFTIRGEYLSCNHDTLGGLFMELDLGNNAYEILNDWHPNAAKEELTAQLTKQVLVEKEQLPKLYHEKI